MFRPSRWLTSKQKKGWHTSDITVSTFLAYFVYTSATANEGEHEEQGQLDVNLKMKKWKKLKREKERKRKW